MEPKKPSDLKVIKPHSRARKVLIRKKKTVKEVIKSSDREKVLANKNNDYVVSEYSAQMPSSSVSKAVKGRKKMFTGENKDAEPDTTTKISGDSSEDSSEKELEELPIHSLSISIPLSNISPIRRFLLTKSGEIQV